MNMMTMKYEMASGKNVYPDLLVNDLDFWLEVQLFQETIDTRIAKLSEEKGHNPCDVECIKDKIRLITKLFFFDKIFIYFPVSFNHSDMLVTFLTSGRHLQRTYVDYILCFSL